MKLAVPAALLGLSTALGLGSAYELARPLDPVVVETSALGSHHVAAPPPASYSPPVEAQFTDINSRPLFLSGRKPIVDTIQTSAAMAATSDFSLVGVIMGESHAIALIHSKSAASTTSAALGDMVSGWRVSKIDATTVTLRANGEEFILQLNGPAGAPPSAPLPPLSPGPQAVPTPAPATPPPVAADAQPAALASPATIPPLKTGAATAPGAITPPKPGAPATGNGGTIAPDALKGAPIDPATGQPTL